MSIPNSVLGFLWHFVKRQPIGFGIMVAGALIWSVNETFFPYFIKLIINAVVNYHGQLSQIYHAVFWPVAALMLMWIIMEAAMRSQGIATVLVFPRFRANIRKAAYDYVKNHSHDYFSNHFAGSIASKIADLPSSSERLLEIIVYNFIGISMAVLLTLILMYSANIVFAAVMLGWVVVHISISLLFLKKGNRLAKIHSEMVSTLNGKIVDSLTNMLSVRLFARTSFESHYLQQYQQEEITKSKRAQWHLQVMNLWQGLATLVLIFSMIGLLIYGWGHQWISIGDFTLISMLSFGMLGLIWFVSFQINIFVREAGKIKAALNLITVPHAIQDKPQAKILKVTRGEICFNKVDFAYGMHTPIFKQLSVTIKAGEKIGLVGISGAGKSSLANQALLI